MLAGDERSAWDSHVLDDPRVISLWDPERTAGRWFSAHQTGGLGGTGGVVWDAYLAFGSRARWQTTPSNLLAAGSDIISTTDNLNKHFTPTLATE